jgi:homoserine O-acetyltransferase/O-succinyltransferase
MTVAVVPTQVPGATVTHAALAISDFATEHGTPVPLFQAHFTHSTPTATVPGRLVIVCPALTGTHRVGTDWWSTLVADGGAIDLRTDTVLCVGNLGAANGSDPWRGLHTDLAFTVRDQVQLVERVRRTLALPPPALIIGGSLGGMVALELAVLHAGRAQAVVLGAPAAQSEWARALNAVQREALRVGGAVEGLRLARSIGVLSYRTPAEFEARWGSDGTDRAPGRDGVSYLRAHAERLQARFDATLYRRLIDMMDTHDVARGRTDRVTVLRTLGDALTAVALDDDLLYPPAVVRQLADGAGGRYEHINTLHGHDGFLIHEGAVARIVAGVFPGRRERA